MSKLFRIVVIVYFGLLSASTLAQGVPTAAPTKSEESGGVAKEVEELRKDLGKTREDLAELKPVSNLSQTVLLFVAGISTLLGIFGWRKFSDLDSLVGEQVKLQLPRSSREYSEFEEMAKSAEEISKKLQEITKDYELALTNLKYLDVLRDDFDIEGKLYILSKESTDRKLKSVNNQAGTFSGTLYETSWRTAAIATISRLPEIIKKKNLDGSMLFNAAQICRRLEQHEIAQQLTITAHDKDPSDANRALMLSSIVKGEIGKGADDAFGKLMEMIRNLSRDSPHIVLAEAWNAAVDQTRFGDLVKAISELEARRAHDPNTFVPSYAYVIQVQAILHHSGPSALAEAVAALQKARMTLGDETSQASWFEASLSEIESCEQKIVLTNAMQQHMKYGSTAAVPYGMSENGDDNPIPD